MTISYETWDAMHQTLAQIYPVGDIGEKCRRIPGRRFGHLLNSTLQAVSLSIVSRRMPDGSPDPLPYGGNVFWPPAFDLRKEDEHERFARLAAAGYVGTCSEKTCSPARDEPTRKDAGSQALPADGSSKITQSPSTAKRPAGVIGMSGLSFRMVDLEVCSAIAQRENITVTEAAEGLIRATMLANAKAPVHLWRYQQGDLGMKLRAAVGYVLGTGDTSWPLNLVIAEPDDGDNKESESA